MMRPTRWSDLKHAVVGLRAQDGAGFGFGFRSKAAAEIRERNWLLSLREGERDAGESGTKSRVRSHSDPLAGLRRLEDCANNPVMSAAAAQIGGKRQPDLRLAWLRVAVKQRLGQHDHAGDAVAALHRLLRYESGLQRVRPLDGPESFERGDLRLPKHGDWRDAGAHRSAVDEHRAGAALAEPAAELGRVEAKIIAQHVEQRRVGFGRYAMHRAVHLETDSHDAKTPLEAAAHLAPALARRRDPTRLAYAMTCRSKAVHPGKPRDSSC